MTLTGKITVTIKAKGKDDIIHAMKFHEPKYFLDETFTVRSYESGVTNHVTLPTLCNYLQEIAGLNADSLGWGIRKLQDEGLTWMLSRLHIKVSQYAPWGDKIILRTWPSGMKGRLVATRCFQGMDSNNDEVLQANSEWLYVDMNAQKIARLPENFSSLVPPGTPDISFPDIGGKFTKLPGAGQSCEIRVRNSDLDFNDHVNNVHYAEWMLEPLAERGGPLEMDIVFRSAAKAGDLLISESFCENNHSFHLISRPSDNTILASAAMVWNEL